MKPKSSPLEILDIAITQMDFKFIPPKEDQNISSFFKKYEIDVDFGIQSNDYLMVYISATVNKGESPLPGYSFFAEATCVFELDKKVDLQKDIKDNLEGFSTIYISLNSLRGFISNFTANAPFGRYILPSVDLNDLIEKKKKTFLKKKVSKSLPRKKLASRG